MKKTRKNLNQQLAELNDEKDSLQSELKNCLDYSSVSKLKEKIILNGNQRLQLLRELENISAKKKFGFSGSKIVCRSSKRKGCWSSNG